MLNTKKLYQFYQTCKAHNTYKTANIFASVMGLGHNKKVLYSKADYTSKNICGFIGVMGLACLIKLVKFFVLITIK